MKPVLSRHRIKRKPSIERTGAEVPKFISLIYFKLQRLRPHPKEPTKFTATFINVNGNCFITVKPVLSGHPPLNGQ